MWFVNCVGKPTTVTVSIGPTTHNIHTCNIQEVSGLSTSPKRMPPAVPTAAWLVTTQTVTTTTAVTRRGGVCTGDHWTWNSQQLCADHHQGPELHDFAAIAQSAEWSETGYRPKPGCRASPAASRA